MRFGIRELVFAAVLVGLVIGATLMLRERAARRAEATQRYEAKERALANLREATSGIEDLERKIDELEQAIVFFESKLPQEKEMDKILKDVWQMAEENSLQTRSIKTLRGERAANYSEQPIQMNLSGDFRGFYAYLLQLEKLARITRVTHMNLTKINDREGEMQAQLTLSIYFEPEASAAAR
jgi:type IV pilus assembly protein PilO